VAQGTQALDLGAVGANQPLAVTAPLDPAGLQHAFAQPAEQRDRRHVQFQRQLAYAPFVGLPIDPRRLSTRRRTRRDALAGEQIGDHRGVKGLPPFGRMPPLGIELPRDLRTGLPLLM
jgi:hypothetical protein